MRLIAVLAVLVVVLWLGMKELSATGSSPASTPRQAQGVANQARAQLQRNEALGTQQLDRGLGAVPSGTQP